jgi:hypothetical protein
MENAMLENSLFDNVSAAAQVRFESLMEGKDFNPFSVAHTAIYDTLRELTAVDYAKLLADQPQLLDVLFETKTIPVQEFTVRRMLGEAYLFELEKRITYDTLDLAVLEKHKRREPPAHMAANFRSAVASRLGVSAGGV